MIIPNHFVLFICNLFADGHFRTVHILHEPKTFDSLDFLRQMDSVCSLPIPLYITDIISITEPSIEPWNQNDTPNNVLQVIFITSKTLSHTNRDKIISKWFAFYRIFAFPSNDMIDGEHEISVIETTHQLFGPNSMVLDYNAESLTVHIDNGHSIQNMCSKSHPILIVNQETDFKQLNLFDRTFGEYERKQTIAINVVAAYVTNADSIPKINSMAGALSKHYHLRLSPSFINVTLLNIHDINGPRENKKVKLNPNKLYKELSDNYTVIDSETQ